MSRYLNSWRLTAYDADGMDNSRWSNKDMDPVPREEQSWSTFNVATYWISDAFSPSTLQLAGSFISLGLSWKLALLAVAMGNIIVSFLCVANGYIGVVLHTSFAVTTRSSFGIWFSYFAVVSRLVIATVYTGTKTFIGAEAVYQMFRGLWPSTEHIPNHLPKSLGITTKLMMCYFIYWLIQTPLTMISPRKLRYLFLFKSIVAPIGSLAVMGWYLHKTNGYLTAGNSKLKGTALTFTWFKAMNAAISNWATLTANVGDFTRYAHNRKAPLVQLLVIPSVTIAGAFMGIAIASGHQKINGGSIQFDPLRIMDDWRSETSGERAALFFFGFSLFLGNLGSNIGANTMSAANDWTVLVPQYLNLKRGAFLTGIIGCWCIVPWKILASAATFLAFLSAYVIFISPIASIMICDFFFVKRGRVDIPAMYRVHGIYRYWHGINLRALGALIVAIAPCLPGLVVAINSKIHVTPAYANFYKFAWIYGTFSSGITYVALSYIFPPRETLIPEMVWPHVHADKDVSAVQDEESVTDSSEEKKEITGDVQPVV